MQISKSTFQVSLLAAAIAITGCGGDSGSSGSDPKVIPVEGFTISAKGGASEFNEGGRGGDVSIAKYNSAAPLLLNQRGDVDTRYTLAEQTLDLGVNPVTLTEAVTVQVVSDGDSAIPAAGTLYMLASDLNSKNNESSSNTYRLYKSDGLTAIGALETRVTGMVLNEGATLILPDHRDGASVRLFFVNDVKNDGQITTVKSDTAASRLSLELSAAAYYGSGTIDLSGDKAIKDGQNGGALTISAYTISNAGKLDTHGAVDGDDEASAGGNGGDIVLVASIFVENKGELNANGGSSSDEQAGRAGNISLSALEVYNSGALSADCGDGITGATASNHCAEIELAAQRTLMNTAAISSLGSSAFGVENGSGSYVAGRGGEVTLSVEPTFGTVGVIKTLVNTGDIQVTGGATSAHAKGNAGRGGVIEITAGDTFAGGPSSERAPSQSVAAIVSGNLSANGGENKNSEENAADGGHGGEISVLVYDQVASKESTRLLGYGEIDTSGGRGLEAGGSGGDIDIYSADVDNESEGDGHALAGPIENSVYLIANAGSTTADEAGEAGYGKDGGDITVVVRSEQPFTQTGELTLSSIGNIYAKGGNSYKAGSSGWGWGGDISLQTPDTLTVQGGISADGGADLHTAEAGDNSGHEGGRAGGVMLVSQYGQTNLDSSISVNGGDGSREGGDAGFVAMIANSGNSAEGTFALNGGNAAADEEDTFAETQAGKAGEVYVLSMAYNSNVKATIDAQPGTGDVPGKTSIVMIDGDCETNNCGVDFGSQYLGKL